MLKWIDRLKELIYDWAHLVKRNGWKHSRSYILKEIVSLPYRKIHYVVLASNLSGALPEYRCEIDLEFRPFDDSDLDFVCHEYLHSEANLCRQRLKAGQKGLVASTRGQTAGYCWLSTDDRLERVQLNMIAGDILLSDAFTAPAFRNKGVNTALILAIMSFSQDLGHKRLIAYIDIDNAPSLAVWQKKLRAEIIESFDFKRIGFWRKTKYICRDTRI